MPDDDRIRCHLKAEHERPHTAVIQELLTAVRLAAHCIPDGTVHAGALGERDGAEVRTRLKRAALAARFALDPEHARRFAAEQAARKAEEASDAT